MAPPPSSSYQETIPKGELLGTLSWLLLGPNQPAETQPLTSHLELLVQLVYTAQVTGSAGRCKQDIVFMALNSCPDKPIRPWLGAGSTFMCS